MAAFDKLVRFSNPAAEIFYGEVGHIHKVSRDTLIGLSIPVFRGGDPWDNDFQLTEQKEIIVEVPIFLCVGLNYKQHAMEAAMSTGTYPTIFTKPPDALAGPFEDIPVHPECQSMDYEAELCVIMGKDCKNVSESEDPLQYVLGYTAGNDVSSRWWQMPERSNNQHGVAKSFDKFAPLGPVITSSKIIPDPTKLTMTARVNGDLRQSTRTDDMVYNIPHIIRHLSRGATLRKGTVIMTGTPSGVAAFMKPPAWLKDGDVVEVEIDNIGAIRNRMVFEK